MAELYAYRKISACDLIPHLALGARGPRRFIHYSGKLSELKVILRALLGLPAYFDQQDMSDMSSKVPGVSGPLSRGAVGQEWSRSWQGLPEFDFASRCELIAAELFDDNGELVGHYDAFLRLVPGGSVVGEVSSGENSSLVGTMGEGCASLGAQVDWYGGLCRLGGLFVHNDVVRADFCEGVRSYRDRHFGSAGS